MPIFIVPQYYKMCLCNYLIRKKLGQEDYVVGRYQQGALLKRMLFASFGARLAHPGMRICAAGDMKVGQKGNTSPKTLQLLLLLTIE